MTYNKVYASDIGPVLAHHSHTFTRFPAPSHVSSQGSRGFHGDIILIDEFSFVPHDVLYENALIQMVVENRSLIAISSPIEAESERMMLLNKKQSKAPFKNYFDILNLSTICSACADEKKTFCPHRLENRAVWKSMASENKLRDLMPILYFRKEAKKYRHRHTSNVFIQVLGEQVKTTEYLFERKLLDPIFGADFIRATPSSILGNTVFVAVDPCSGGGSASKIGITAIYYTAKAAQLVVRIVIHLQSQR